MAITYPLDMPTDITGLAQIDVTMTDVVGSSRSPYTLETQEFLYAGAMWSANVVLPRTNKKYISEWISFLQSLRGRFGSFLLGDPDRAAPRGKAYETLHNDFLYTEQFDNAYWSKVTCIVDPNVVNNADLNQLADKLKNDTTASTFHYIARTVAGVNSGETHHLMLDVRAAEYSWFCLQFGGAIFGGAAKFAFFNVSSGAFGNISSGVTATMEDLGVLGWWRCKISVVATASASKTLQFILATGNGVTSYTGDGVSGVFIANAMTWSGIDRDYEGVYDGYGPVVNGAGQTGSSISLKYMAPNRSSYLMKGDHIQIGLGVNSRLHSVLNNVTPNSSGIATIDIWPPLRSSPADGASVTLFNPRGLFRLKTNQRQYSIDDSSFYSVSFDCEEVI